ncbi:MAG: hypothetical protein ACKE5M_02955 [Methylophilaceae bacterium]
MSCQPIATENIAKEKTPQVVHIYVTVDWEGISLDQENIEEMQVFRKKFPHIPMLQLVNPAYFLRDHPSNARLTKVIKSTFLPTDTQGLHVHAWKSLTNYCGVPYQYSHSFADTDENCKTGDCGYTVSLENAYSQNDLTKLIACSNQVLIKNGFKQSVHFRAGGWQLGPKLIAALEADGFVWDSSAIDANLLTTRWHKDSGMVTMLRKLHPTSTPLDQPYALSAQLKEYPNNAALADYTSTKQIIRLFNNLVKANKKVMVLGFHQETAVDFLGRLEQAIPQMEANAKANNVKIEWVSK